MPLTLRSKSLAMLSIAQRRSAAARAWVAASACSRPRIRTALSLKIWTVAAIAPTSSPRPMPGISPSSLPSASACMRAPSRPSGRLMLRPIIQAMLPAITADAENGKAQQPGDRLHLGVEVVEIGAGADIHVEAGNRDGVADLADRLFLAGLHIFIGQQDRAVGLDAVHQFHGQLAAVGHHVHAVGADLLRIGRQDGDAVIAGAEQIAGALVVGHGIGALAEFGDGRFLGHLAGIDLLLQAGGHVAAHFDDRLGLVDARVQHLALHQIAREHAGCTEAEQRHTHQNTELGGDLQVGQLHGGISGNLARATRLAK